MSTLNALVVEDSVLVADRIVALLNVEPVKVVATMATEEGALQVCERFSIDLAVIDLQLAQGTGFGVIRRLREKGRPPCAIAVFTNHAVPALKRAAYEAGADYFLDKCKDFEALGRLVRELAAAIECECQR